MRSFVVAIISILLLATFCNGSSLNIQRLPSNPNVKLDFYVMAKCPDAEVCEAVFAPAVVSLSAIIDLRVNYIARYLHSNMSCPHGPTECVGDKQQLCAQLLSPSSALTWWNFTACQSATRNTIPANAEACAANTSISFPLLSACVEHAGERLLYASALTSAAAGQSISCTLTINDQQWCQHNGDWVGCDEGNDADSLIAAVCKRYKGDDAPPACKGVSTGKRGRTAWMSAMK